MNTELTQGVPEGKKQEFIATVKASTTLIDALHRVLNERLRLIEAQEAKLTDYDSAAWPYKQANRNGRQTAYRELIQLLTFKKD
jgi:hypothetical protein